MRNKYNAHKTTVNGKSFDSKKEAQRYAELLFLQRKGEITDLELQRKFELIPSLKDALGKTVERPVTYIADFVYIQDGKMTVEDVKGYRTPEYVIKRKLMLYVHGIRIKET